YPWWSEVGELRKPAGENAWRNYRPGRVVPGSGRTPAHSPTPWHSRTETPAKINTLGPRSDRTGSRRALRCSGRGLTIADEGVVHETGLRGHARGGRAVPGCATRLRARGRRGR